MNTNESSWKPSEGQLECLEYAINNAEKDYSPLAGNRIYLTLKALKKQLEKIKNENIAIEDYKKKYEDALARAREMCAMPIDKATIEYIFPELKESEDERIRKHLISLVKNWDKDGIVSKYTSNANDIKQILAWLEKQKSVGEIVERCKNSWYNEGKIAGMLEGLTDDEKYQQGWHDALEKQGKQKVSVDDFKANNWYVSKVDGKIYDMTYNPTDKVEPKFKVGDWVVCEVTNSVYQIKNCIENLSNHKYGYDLTNGGYIGSDEVNHYHLWTIQDAKEGDVLASSKSIFLFKGIYMASKPESYCAIMDGYFFSCPEGCWTNEQCYPATKEERNLLFQKMKEAGFEWDAEKKELKLLISNGGDFEPELSHQEATEKSEQEPTNWTDKDEELFISYSNNVLDLWKKEYAEEFIDWIKSLKQRLS